MNSESFILNAPVPETVTEALELFDSCRPLAVPNWHLSYNAFFGVEKVRCFLSSARSASKMNAEDVVMRAIALRDWAEKMGDDYLHGMSGYDMALTLDPSVKTLASPDSLRAFAKRVNDADMDGLDVLDAHICGGAAAVRGYRVVVGEIAAHLKKTVAPHPDWIPFMVVGIKKETKA